MNPRRWLHEHSLKLLAIRDTPELRQADEEYLARVDTRGECIVKLPFTTEHSIRCIRAFPAYHPASAGTLIFCASSSRYTPRTASELNSHCVVTSPTPNERPQYDGSHKQSYVFPVVATLTPLFFALVTACFSWANCCRP